MKPLPTLPGLQAFAGAERSGRRSKVNEVRLDMKTNHEHHFRFNLPVTFLCPPDWTFIQTLYVWEKPICLLLCWD